MDDFCCFEITLQFVFSVVEYSINVYNHNLTILVAVVLEFMDSCLDKLVHFLQMKVINIWTAIEVEIQVLMALSFDWAFESEIPWNCDIVRV